ncbi:MULTISPECIES: hypothetical protein [Rodentibacter]|uniref:Uncharacterized protein n=2 Tax=Rodentibacter TaxID=1960084 RepID=A0A1V3IKR7_9PAST|nr:MULTISPECIES: hypothetical protein [Rodentibacter]OOF42317.1 hypothetical protein BKK50_06855 [Rodentibacter rarus]OOF44780.1 hypothetical protein BKK51_07980 [Rodentibacter trehalosifermentans]OOF51888.1 hypothetical protein BKK53_06850 [Rodentibacter trehalosifermentans]
MFEFTDSKKFINCCYSIKNLSDEYFPKTYALQIKMGVLCTPILDFNFKVTVKLQRLKTPSILTALFVN